MHVICPDELWKDPMGQFVHSFDPTEAANVPGKQSRHAAEFEAAVWSLNVPIGHFSQ
jgi:hypothetical protein